MTTLNRALTRLLVGVVVLAALAVVVGLLLPGAAEAERSITIAATPTTVFTLLDGFTRFAEWSPSHDLDPATASTLDGPEHGVGASISWTGGSPPFESGTQRVLAAEPFKLVRIGLELAGRGAAESTFVIAPEPGRTRVTWRLHTEHGWSPVARLSGLAFDRVIGPYQEQGLARLKALAQSFPSADWSQLEISVEELEPLAIAVTAGGCGPGPAAASAALAEAFGRVREFLSRSRIAQAGAPVAITREWDAEDGWQFFAGIPIAEPPAVRPERQAPVRIGQTPEGRNVVAVHVGPYAGLESTYDAIAAYMAVHGLEAAGPRWEQYVSDPGTTPAAELITRVCVPVR
jgi:effector-binding domain-containing protein/uncharacterized protein YndB with AHSA1/START domain